MMESKRLHLENREARSMKNMELATASRDPENIILPGACGLHD
jgi:hypothetical protein